MTVQVAAGLVLSEGRYLITKRKAGTHLGGLWEFPGGKRQPDESMDDCLRRELREELGIEISAPVFFRTIRHEYPNRAVELHFFRCTIQKGEPQARGCEAFRWVRPEELSRYEFPPADRSLLETLVSGVSRNS